MEILSVKEIKKSISRENLKILEDIKVLKTTNSTNDVAKNFFSSMHNVDKYFACYAEEQTLGRGRNNNEWISPPNKNIYFSFGWQTKLSFQQLEGLSLAVGVEISKCLNNLIDPRINIKWPNDLIINGKKLGGILIETSVSKENIIDVVIGIGINVLMKYSKTTKITQDWTSLFYHTNKIINRNNVAGLVLNAMINLANNYKERSFKFYKEDFIKLSILQGLKCSIGNKSLITEGIVKGVNDYGELLIDTSKGIKQFRYGGDSIRVLTK